MDRDRPGLLPLLQEALALETKFQPCLELPLNADDEITAGVRDGAVHVLRCLKVWYDFPSDVLFIAVNIMDRFLTRMKARQRHMACISVSSFLLATRMVPNITAPELQDLISISQCKCSIGDLERMKAIIEEKVSAGPHTAPVTPLSFLRLIQPVLGTDLLPDSMLQLEILACDANCVNFRPCEVALVILQPTSEQMRELQTVLRVNSERLRSCTAAVKAVLERYYAHAQVANRQRLVWRLSHRTMRHLRPTDRLVRRLPTIDENGLMSDDLCEDDDCPPAIFHCDLA